MAGWSNSYLSLELEPGTIAQLEISMLWGEQRISKAVTRPSAAAQDCHVDQHGRAKLTVNQPALFTVDINGQMEDQDTGRGYK